MGQKRKQSKVTLCKKASPARLENALHLKSRLAKIPLNDQAYREKLATLSPGELLGVKKPSFLLFCTTGRNSLEVWKSPIGTCFLTIFCNSSSKNYNRCKKLHQNPPLYALRNPLLNSTDMHYVEAY